MQTLFEEIKMICGIKDIQDIFRIVYFNDDFGIGGIRFKHIDIETCYGDFLELHEEEALYQEIFEHCNLSKAEEKEEIVLYQKEP